MSHSVEVCIKYPGTLEELKAEVEKVLGIGLPHYQCGSTTLRSYNGRLLTIDLALSTNYLDTDREINFADFQYVLSTRVAGHACAQRLLELQLSLTEHYRFTAIKLVGGRGDGDDRSSGATRQIYRPALWLSHALSNHCRTC